MQYFTGRVKSASGFKEGSFKEWYPWYNNASTSLQKWISKMGAMMARASWSFWHVKEKIDFKKAGIQSSRLSPSSLTIADLQVRGMKTAHFDASGRRR